MIPLRDHNPTTHPIILVPVLVAINIVVFLFIQPTFRTAGADARAALIEQTQFTACHASIPYEIIHGDTVFDAVQAGDLRDDNAVVIGAAEGGKGPFPAADACPRKNIWFSIFASMFMHGGWLHIGGNMLFLWVFGNNIEDRLGPAKFLVFYLLAGVVSTYAQAVVAPSSTVPLIGASGAIAGVLGAYLLLYPRARVTTLIIFFFITAVELPAVVVLGVWFLLQVFQGVGSVTGDAGGVAYLAHVGGFVAGALLIKAFRPRPASPMY